MLLGIDLGQQSFLATAEAANGGPVLPLRQKKYQNRK
jgi:hypothetical protein